MEKVEYWQTSFETKLNLADAFISDLCVKYCEQRMNAGEFKKAVEFSKSIYRVQEVFNSFRSIFNRATYDNENLVNEVNLLRKQLNEYKQTDNALDKVGLAQAELKYKQQIEDEFNAKLIEFKDKYQIRIQELEIETDQLLKQLIRKNNE